MKKLLLTLAFILALTSPAISGDWTASETTGENVMAVGTNEIIVNGECWVTAITVITDGTNNADVDFYDCANPVEFIAGTYTSCKKMWTITVYSTDYYGGRAFPFPLHFQYGVFADAEGTGAPVVYVEYIRAR